MRRSGRYLMDEPIGELVQRAQAGDAAAYAALIRRYERAAIAVVYAVTAHGESVGDVVQEALMKAWKSIGDLREPDRFGPWFVAILRRTALRERRRLRRSRMEPLPEMELEHGQAADPVQGADEQETRSRIHAALDGLDETSRTAVVLRYYEGLPSKEIGQLLGLSPAAIDMRLARARARLSQMLAPLAAR